MASEEEVLSGEGNLQMCESGEGRGPGACVCVCVWGGGGGNGRLYRALYGVTTRVTRTLRASLSGTFLQTLPDLVTPLKGHSLSQRSCPPTLSAPSERFGY